MILWYAFFFTASLISFCQTYLSGSVHTVIFCSFIFSRNDFPHYKISQCFVKHFEVPSDTMYGWETPSRILSAYESISFSPDLCFYTLSKFSIVLHHLVFSRHVVNFMFLFPLFCCCWAVAFLILIFLNPLLFGYFSLN